MDNIVGWNICVLNLPNKLVDINNYLFANKAGLVGDFETKVKEVNVDNVTARVFPGWNW